MNSTIFTIMKKLNNIFSCLLYAITLCVVLSTSIFAQAVGDYRGSTAGNWGTRTNWQRWNGTGWVAPTIAQGYPGQNAASANAAVTVQNGISMTVNVSPANTIGSLTIAGGGTATNLTFNAGISLTVVGAIQMNAGTGNNDNRTIAVGAGILNAGSVSMVSTGADNIDCIITLSTGTMTIAGNLVMPGTFARNHIDITGAGTLNIGGEVDNGAGAVGGGFTAPPATSVINLNGSASQTVFLYGGNSALGILKINNAAGVTAGSDFTTRTLTIGDVTPNSVFNAGTFAVTVSANLTVNGPLNGTGDIVLSGAGATIDGTGSIAAPTTVSANHTINATADLTITGTMTINNGVTVTNNGSVTASDLGNATGAWTQGNNSTLNYTGASITPTLTATASGNTIHYNGTFADQDIHGGMTYYNLQISNGSSKLLQTGDVTVSNLLTLNSCKLRTGDYNLMLTAAATVAGAPFSSSNMIQTDGIGYVEKSFGTAPSGAAMTYPVGTDGYYSPFDLSNFSASGTGTVQIRATTANQGANALAKYWLLTVTGTYAGITTNLRFAYNAAEVRGVQSQYDTWYYNGSWSLAQGTRTPLGSNPFGSNISGASAATISGRWSAGSTAPATSVSLYSYQSGNWTDITSWTSDPSGTTWINPGVPGNSDNVTILNGRTITIGANNKQVSTLAINSGGVLDIGSTTGHNFGTVTGQGKLMLSSNAIPGGALTSFVASNGGTIEYYNLNNVSISTTQATYNNLIISNYSTGANSVYLNNGTNPTTYEIFGDFSVKNYSSGSQTVYFGNPTPSNNLINLTVYGNFSVDAECNVRVNNFAAAQTIPDPTNNTTPYPVHMLSLYGNFTNNGSVRFTELASPVNTTYYTLGTTNGAVQVYFKGATNNTVTCNGVTDFFRLVVEKGTDKTYVLEVNSSNTNNFALYAPNDQGSNNFAGGPEGYGYGAYYKALFVRYGTLKLNENINIPSLTEGGQDFNVIPTAKLWINGATVSTTVSGVNGTGYQAATLYGALTISAGTFSTGDAAGIVLGTLGTPIIRIEGTGTLDVSQAWTENLSPNQMSYIQTGGTANFRIQGENHAGPMLNLSNVNAVFIMSGGTMNFEYNTFADATFNYNILDIQCQAGNYEVTGGTLNFNLPSSATAYTANATVPFYNLNIARRTGAGTVSVQWNTPGSTLSVLNNLTINGNSTLNLNTSLIDLAVGGNFTIAAGGTYTPATGAANITTFNGTAAQAFNNIGTITGNALNNLTITNSSVTSIINNNVTVNRALTINNNATLNDSGRFIYVLGNIINRGIHAGQLSAGGIRLTGTTAQTIDGGGTGSFYNLIIDKPNATGASLIGNASVTGNLRLINNANFNIGSRTLSLGVNSSIYTDLATAQNYDNTHMISTGGLSSDGGVSKTYSGTPAFRFPVGFGTYYLPASIQFSSTPDSFGTVNTKPVNARHPLAQGTNNALTCYWKTSGTGFSGIPASSVRHLYTYNTAFVAGTEISYRPGFYNNSTSSWVFINDSLLIDDVNNIISYNAANSADGEFMAAEPSAFGAIPTLYSVANGNWNAASTWSTTRGGTAGNGGTPTVTTLVNICDDKIVTATAAASSSSLNLEVGSTLDVQNITGHNFGTITGRGTLRIASSNYFPAGDWADFLSSAGGTVEYYQTAAGTLNLPTTYALPVSGSAAITGYHNLTTLPFSGGNIILPNTDLLIHNNFTVGYSGAATANCVTQLNAGGTTRTVEVMGNLIVNTNGILQYMNTAAQNVIADNSITIAASGTLQVINSAAAIVNSLTVYGSITNNGALNLDATNNDCNLIFTGSSNKSLSGTPTQTRLYGIRVDIGASRDSVLNMNVGTTGFAMGAGGLTLLNGTFRLTTPVSMNLSTGSFTIPVTACLSADGGTLNIATGAGPDSLILNGRLEVLSGSVNVGPAISTTSNAFNIVYASAGTPEIVVAGGTLTVYSQIRREAVLTSGALNYTQTGGTVTIGAKNANIARAAFEVLNTGSKFVMSGGTLIVANHVSAAAPYDLTLGAAVSTVTGGTIQFGLSTITPNQTLFYFQSSNTLNNLTLEATTNARAIQQVHPLHVLGSLTIGGTSGYYNANELDVFIGGNLTNNNTDAASNGLTVGGYRTQIVTQNTTLNGTVNQTITGTASNRTNFANLEMAGSSGRTLYLSSGACNVTVNGNLKLSSGTLNDGGNTIYLLNNISNSAVHYSPSATTGGMMFAGTANQGMSGSGTGTFGNIEINNADNDVNMTNNTTINGQLKFTNGTLYIDDYALTLGVDAAIAGTVNLSNMILLNGVSSDKGVTKIFPSNASVFTFPIGVSGKYTPCTFDFSSNSNPAGATINVIPVDDLHPTIDPDSYSNYLNYYWNITTTGFSSDFNVQHSYTYIATDVAGTPSNIERYSAPLWTSVSTTVGSPTFSFTTDSLLDGSYTIGDPFTGLPVITSQQSGNWNTAATWDLGIIPNGHPVVIRSADSVALSANGASAASVTINGVLDAMNTTFHTLGAVSGNGKIKLLSTGSGMFVFPAGSYDAFFANESSTVEFYGSSNGTLPLDVGDVSKPYQHVIFSGTGIKYISSVDMKVIGNAIFMPGSKLDNSLYNKDMYLLGNWIDNNTVTGGFTSGTGAVRFSGTALQKIIMANNSMTETFYNLAINNAAGLTIQTGKAVVGNQLILTLGNINTGSTNTLTIDNTGTNAIVGSSVNSFVNGPLSKKIINGSNFQFPVGDAVSSSRKRIGYVSVTSTSTTGTQIWTAQFIDKNPTTDNYNIASLASPLTWLNNNEYWRVIGPSGGKANIVLTWDSYTGMSSSASARAQSRVAKWNTPAASQWNGVNQVVSDYGRDSGTVATSVQVNFPADSILTIGAAVIPVGTFTWAIQTGMWNNPSIWFTGFVPGPLDTVSIDTSRTVTLDAASNIAKLLLGSTGTLVDGGYTIGVTGSILLNGTWTGSGALNWTTDDDTLNGTGAVSGSTILQVNGNKVVGTNANVTLASVSISSGKTLTNNGRVTIQTVTGADGTSLWINAANSTLNVSGALMPTGVFNASAVPNTVAYNGAGAQTIFATTYSNLQTATGGTKTAAGGFTVNKNLTIGSSTTFADGGFTITVKDSVTNNGTHSGTGKILVDGSTQHQLKGIGSFTNLELNNSSNGATLDSNLTVNGTLILTNGIITAPNDTLFISSTGSIVRTNGHINGNLRKYFAPASDSLTFELGTASSSEYLPVTISFGTITTGGNLTMRMAGGEHFDITHSSVNPDSNVNRYWVGNNNGIAFDRYNITVNWLSSDRDANFSNYSDFIMAIRSNNGDWDELGAGAVTSTSMRGMNGTSFSTFAAGLPLAQLFTSIATGSWSTKTTWDVNKVPKQRDSVVIASPHIVTLSANSSITKLTINAGGEFADAGYALDLYGTFELSGNWSGSGRINWNYDAADTLTGSGGNVTGTSVLFVNGTGKLVTATNSTLNRIQIASGKTVTNNGSVSITDLIGDAASATWVNSAGSVLNVADTLLTTGTLTATANNNTVGYNGAGAQTILPIRYHHLATATGGTKTIGGNLVVTGNMTIGGSTTLNVAATTDTVYGNWNNSGAVNASTSRIVFAGSGNSALTGSTTFNDLVINKNSASTVVQLASNVQAANVIMNTGKLHTGSNAINITTGRTGNGIILGTITRTHAFNSGTSYEFESPNNTLTFNAGGTLPTSVTVFVDTVSPGANTYMEPINRYYTISQTGGSGFTYTLRLHYEDSEVAPPNDETSLRLWQRTSTGPDVWDRWGVSDSNITANWLEKDSINTMGTWGLSSRKVPNVTLTLSANAVNPVPGDTVIYTIVYTNIGDGNATNTIVSASSPLQTSYVANSVAVNTVGINDNTGGVTVNSGNISVNLQTIVGGPLIPGANGTITYKVIIN